jgi:hypothetical protein
VLAFKIAAIRWWHGLGGLKDDHGGKGKQEQTDNSGRGSGED